MSSSNKAGVGLRMTATHDARHDVEVPNVFVPHEHNVCTNNQNELDSDDMYMTELEATEWDRAQPHVEPEPDADKADIMEGYHFDLGDYGPDIIRADDNPQIEQAESYDNTAYHMDVDVNMIDNFGLELDIEQLRAEVQHTDDRRGYGRPWFSSHQGIHRFWQQRACVHKCMIGMRSLTPWEI